jgi:hypothetical protein
MSLVGLADREPLPRKRSWSMAWGLCAVLLAGAVGCGPSADKVCDHVMEIAVKELKELGAKVTDDEVKDQKKKCIADGEKLKKDNKPRWDCESKCSMAATKMRDLEECEKKCK